MTDTVEYKGETFTKVCGFPIKGMFTAFPCCLEPEHEGNHVFAGYYAVYLQEPDGMYEWKGRAENLGD